MDTIDNDTGCIYDDIATTCHQPPTLVPGVRNTSLLIDPAIDCIEIEVSQAKGQ